MRRGRREVHGPRRYADDWSFRRANHAVQQWTNGPARPARRRPEARTARAPLRDAIRAGRLAPRHPPAALAHPRRATSASPAASSSRPTSSSSPKAGSPPAAEPAPSRGTVAAPRRQRGPAGRRAGEASGAALPRPGRLRPADGRPDLAAFPRARLACGGCAGLCASCPTPRSATAIRAGTRRSGRRWPSSSGATRGRRRRPRARRRLRRACPGADRRPARAAARLGARRVAVEDPGWRGQPRAARRRRAGVVAGRRWTSDGHRRRRARRADGPSSCHAGAPVPDRRGARARAAARARRLGPRAGALIVEDDYDAEYRYDREPVGAVQALAPDRVRLRRLGEQDARARRCGSAGSCARAGSPRDARRREGPRRPRDAGRSSRPRWPTC